MLSRSAGDSTTPGDLNHTYTRGHGPAGIFNSSSGRSGSVPSGRAGDCKLCSIRTKNGTHRCNGS
jgi:hypothetical protein